MALPAGFVPDEGQHLPEGFVPDEPPHVSTKPAAPFIPEKPPTFSEELAAAGSALLQPFKDIGRGALAANDFAARAIRHPIETFGGGKAGAVVRESMRGINANIPFANAGVEAIGGPPEVSPQDAALAPGANQFGALLGTPVAGMVGGIAAKPVEAGAELLGKGLRGISREAAGGRQVTRAIEDLGEKTSKRTRAGVNTDVAETLVKENPELRAAAGNDAKVAETLKAAKQTAGNELRQIYSSAPSEVSPSNAIANMDTKIAELSKGTSAEREVARALKSVRDEFQAAHGEKTAVTPQELRAEQSAYQKKGYGKAMPGDEAANARIEANREASKAVGDAVVRHVTGMDYQAAKAAAKADPNGIAARLFKANDTINAANKFEAGIAERAARVQPKEGVIGKLHALSNVVDVQHPLKIVPHAVEPLARGADAVLAAHGPAEATLMKFVEAAKAGNPFAQRQLRILAATPQGAARIAALQTNLQQGAP